MRKISLVTLLADVVWIPGALVTAHWAYGHYNHAAVLSLAHYVHVVLAAAILWVGLQSRITIEGSRASSHLPAMMSQVTVASSFLLVAMLATAFLAHEMLSRGVMLITGFLLLGGFIGIRLMARWAVQVRARHGGTRRAVILGDGHLARELRAKLERHPELMLEVVGYLYPSTGAPLTGNGTGNATGESLSSVDVLGRLKQQGISEVLVAQPQVSQAEIKRMIAACRSAGMQVRLVPLFYELYLARTSMVEVEGVPLVTLREPVFSSAAMAIKRGVDLAAGSFLLVVTAPLVLLAAFYLKLNHRKTFQREQRCGLSGVIFGMHRLGIERGDPSLDFMERILAATSITELPQLVNVLNGEMSLVGPRPEDPQRVKRYSEWQRQRLSVKPGITGLAQVYGLREHDSSDAKANYDLEYILNWSAGGDVSLIVQTGWTLLLRIREAWIRPPKPVVPSAPGTRLEVFRSEVKSSAITQAAERSMVNADSA